MTPLGSLENGFPEIVSFTPRTNPFLLKRAIPQSAKDRVSDRPCPPPWCLPEPCWRLSAALNGNRKKRKSSRNEGDAVSFLLHLSQYRPVGQVLAQQEKIVPKLLPDHLKMVKAFLASKAQDKNRQKPDLPLPLRPQLADLACIFRCSTEVHLPCPLLNVWLAELWLIDDLLST